MRSPSSMITSPPGWQVHRLWYDLDLEVHEHQVGLAIACICLAFLMLGRALLPVSDRSRVRLAVFFVVVYLVALFVKAALLNVGQESSYEVTHLIASVTLSWAVVGVGGMLAFDLVGRRFGVPKILRDLVVSLASLVALILVLSRSGVNFLSIITTSAVLTAVIGLALQDTLGNLFTGVALQLESSISLGDWIRLDERPLGRIVEMRWRSTLLRTTSDELVIIPNGMFSRGVITIINKDELQSRRTVLFNVHLRHAPNLVQETVLEAIAGTPNVSAATPPDCVFLSFEDSFARYAVRYRIVNQLRDTTTDSEIRKRIWYAMHRANIEIPYPGHNVFVTEMSAERAHGKSERERARRLELLGRVGILAPLVDSERNHIAEGLRHVVFGAGEVILRAGDPGDSLFVIRSGHVAVKICVGNIEKEVATLGEGEFFGEMSLMTGEPRHATVVAKSDTECYVIDRALFQQLLQRNATLAEEIGKLLSEREMRNKIDREGLSAEAARVHADHQALLSRIRSFFGLS